MTKESNSSSSSFFLSSFQMKKKKKRLLLSFQEARTAELIATGQWSTSVLVLLLLFLLHYWICCKTPLISTYVFSGWATVQVLIFGGRTYFRGYDKAEAKIQQGKSLFNLGLSVENTLLCMFQRLCTYVQDTGVLILGGGGGGGMYFRGIAADSKFQEIMKGYLFFIFVLRKKGSKTKERMKEEEIEKGDCGPPTRKVFFWFCLILSYLILFYLILSYLSTYFRRGTYLRGFTVF